MLFVFYVTKKKLHCWRICSLKRKSLADPSVLWAGVKRCREKQGLGGSEWACVKEPRKTHHDAQENLLFSPMLKLFFF